MSAFDAPAWALQHPKIIGPVETGRQAAREAFEAAPTQPSPEPSQAEPTETVPIYDVVSGAWVPQKRKRKEKHA